MSAVVLVSKSPPSGDVEGRWRLGHEPASAGLARRLVAQTMGGGVLPASEAVQRRAILATSELIANAVRHASAPIDLEIRRSLRGWVVVVSDGEPGPPVPRVAGQLSEGGRGWLIIDRATEGHGWVPLPAGRGGGKAVWVELWER